MKLSKSLRFGSRMLARRFSRLHPYEVQLQILNACGRHCVYCKCPDVQLPTLTTEQWRGVIRRLAAIGTVRIKFQGGEAVMRPDFRELSGEAKNHGIITAVVSHGATIAADPSLLDFIDEVVVSFDSPNRATNDRLRGNGGYNGAVGAVDAARRRGLKVFVVMTITRDNFDDLEAMLQFCEEHGAKMHAQPVIFGRKYYEDGVRGLAITTEQLKSAYGKMAAWSRAGRAVLFAPESYERAFAWPDINELTTKSDGRSDCMAGRYYVHIEPDGDVLPCVQHGADFEPKNLIRDGIDEALLHATRHNCGNCYSAYLQERKRLYALEPKAIWAALTRE